MRIHSCSRAAASRQAVELARSPELAQQLSMLVSSRAHGWTWAVLRGLTLSCSGTEGSGEAGASVSDGADSAIRADDAYLLDVHLLLSPWTSCRFVGECSREQPKTRLALKQSQKRKFSSRRGVARAEPRRRFASLTRYTTVPRLNCTRSRLLYRPVAVPPVVEPHLSSTAIASLTPPLSLNLLSATFRITRNVSWVRFVMCLADPR